MKKFFFFIVVALSCVSYGDMLETLDRSQASNLYIFDQNLIYKGTANRLICAYEGEKTIFSPFTDLSFDELIDLKRNNVSLVYYSPELDVLGDEKSEKNTKTQRQLGYLADSGMNAWVDVLGANLYPVNSTDVGIISDIATEKAWVDAVSKLNGKESSNLISLARAWDIRLEMLLEKRVVDWGNFFCEYSGVRIVDNPIFGVWSFQSNWLDRMCAGDWRELPEFFRSELNKEWNNWVYNEVTKSTEDFKKVYKFLVNGESVEKGTLKLIALNQHPTIKENDSWITLGDQTRAIYIKSKRANLQREFFIQLYINHISRLKSKFLSLGSVSRAAPYFITMSVDDNANITLTDIYFGSQNTPYVSRYLGPSDDVKNESFAFAKEQFEKSPKLTNSSIIMVPYSFFKEITPYKLGFVHFANTVQPSAIKKLGIPDSKFSFVEQDAQFRFGDSETNTIDGINFKVHDTAPNRIVTNFVNDVEVISEQPPDNSKFELSMKYVKIERELYGKQISNIYIFLEYDKQYADYIQLHISSNAFSNFELYGFLLDDSKNPRRHSFNRRGLEKLSLYRDYRLLLINKKSNDFEE